MLCDINNLPALFGSPDSLEPRFSQYLPVHQGKFGRRLRAKSKSAKVFKMNYSLESGGDAS
jgi:hypothetical protein